MMQSLKNCRFWIISLALSVSVAPAAKDRAILEENQGKALLIYNIAKFTVWPPNTTPPEAPFIFALWDEQSLTLAFQNIAGLKTQGHTIKINDYDQNRLPIDCKVLVIPKHRLQAFYHSKDKLDHLPILTVTTDSSVFDAGAMILIEVIDDHLSFSVNLGALKASGLEISGNLLRHANEVNF